MTSTTAIKLDPVLANLRRALAALYGSVLDRTMLFGSRARGDARVDSDYDVAVFLTHVGPGMTEWNRLADLRAQMLADGGPFLDAIPFRVADYDRQTPIMGEIRRDGVIL